MPEEPRIERLRRLIEEQYRSCPTGCGTSFGDSLTSVCQKNVWPARSASAFRDLGSAVCVNVSGLSATAVAKMEIRAPWSS